MEGLSNLQWYDYFRLGTAMLAILAAFRLARVMRHRRSLGQNYSIRLRDFFWLLFAYMFTQTLGALEAVIANGPYKYTIFLSFFTVLVAIRATRMSDEQLIT